MNDEPDFDAIKRIACAYFGMNFERFLSLPAEDLIRIMDLAGVERERIAGVIDALRQLQPEQVCRSMMN
jgi:hypothetical protein